MQWGKNKYGRASLLWPLLGDKAAWGLNQGPLFKFVRKLQAWHNCLWKAMTPCPSSVVRQLLSRYKSSVTFMRDATHKTAVVSCLCSSAWKVSGVVTKREQWPLSSQAWLQALPATQVGTHGCSRFFFSAASRPLQLPSMGHARPRPAHVHHPCALWPTRTPPMQVALLPPLLSALTCAQGAHPLPSTAQQWALPCGFSRQAWLLMHCSS